MKKLIQIVYTLVIFISTYSYGDDAIPLNDILLGQLPEKVSLDVTSTSRFDNKSISFEAKILSKDNNINNGILTCYVTKNTNIIQNIIKQTIINISFNQNGYAETFFDIDFNGFSEGEYYSVCELSYVDDAVNHTIYSAQEKHVFYSGVSDFDKDGIPDYYEILFNQDFGIDDKNSDLDNDGFDLNLEYFNRTNPANPDSIPTVRLIYFTVDSHNGIKKAKIESIVKSPINILDRNVSIKYEYNNVTNYFDIIKNNSILGNSEVVSLGNNKYKITSYLSSLISGQIYDISFNITDNDTTVSSLSTKHTYKAECQYDSAVTDVSIPDAKHISSISHDGIDKYVLTTNDTIYSSDNGTNWISRFERSDEIFIKTIWDGKYFIVVSAFKRSILVSQDGVQWKEYQTNLDSNIISLAWNGEIFVVVGANGLIAISYDAQNWVPVPSNTSATLLDIKWIDDKFVTVGDKGTILFSENGLTWSSQVSNTNETIWTVDGERNNLIATTGTFNDYKILSNHNNNTWGIIRAAPGNRIFWHSINRLFYIAGSTYSLSSEDGLSWNTHNKTALKDTYASLIDGEHLYFGGVYGQLSRRNCGIGNLDTDTDGVIDMIDLDDDNDGIPDIWEAAYLLNPIDATDANLDPDHDGISNLDEYINGTNPQVANDSYEPDNSSNTANPISVNIPQIHSINPATDDDWVKFSIAKPSSLRLSTSGQEGNDTRMWLYNESLSEISFNDDIEVGNFYSQIIYHCTNPLLAGTYYVKIDEFNKDNSISQYSLSLSDVHSCAVSSNNVSTIIPIIMQLLLE